MPDQKASVLFSEFPPYSKEAWTQQAIKDLKGADFNRKLTWRLEDHLAIAPFYTTEDLEALPNPAGFQNLNANTSPTPVAPREWETREYLVPGHPTETNKAALEALNQGASGIMLDFTEVGINDLEALLKDIMPAYCSVSFRTNNSAFAIMKRYKEYLQNQQVDLSLVTGQLGFDPLSRWMATGEVESSCYHQIHDVLEVAAELPQFRAFTVSGKLVKDSGATISQEIGTILAMVATYLDQLTESGIAPKQAFQQMAIEVGVAGKYFPEIAKLRALRYLISRMAEAYGVTDFGPEQVYISAESAVWNKTIFDPYVNMLRNTTEAMAAVLGGANSVTVLPHDHVFRRSDDFSRRIARNISNLLREESHLDKVVDPAAGSFFIEDLTQQLADQGWKFFQEIETHDGLIKCFKKGWLQEQISQNRHKMEKKYNTRTRKLVGVNAYPSATEKLDPEAISLNHKGVKDPEEYPLLHPFRAAEAFESLRLDTERMVKREGNSKRPKVYLALVGDPVMRKARASFSAGFFGTAGFHIMPEAIHTTWHDAAEAAANSEADIVVLCGSDENYDDFGEGFAELFTRKSKGKMLVLAGCPQVCLDRLSNAGFEFFISAQINAVEMLRTFQKRLNITKA